MLQVQVTPLIRVPGRMVDSTEIKGTLRDKSMTTEPEEILRREREDLLQVYPDIDLLQVYPDTDLLQVYPDTDLLQVHPDTKLLQVYPDTELQLGTDIRRRT